MLHKFELGYKDAEIAKNICCAKSESAVDHSTITKCLNRFRSGYKNLDGYVRSGRPKTVDSEAVLQAIEANPGSMRRDWYLSEMSFVIFMTSVEISGASEWGLTLPNYYEIFASFSDFVSRV